MMVCSVQRPRLLDGETVTFGAGRAARGGVAVEAGGHERLQRGARAQELYSQLLLQGKPRNVLKRALRQH